METKRLILDSFNQDDASRVKELAGDIRVVEMTALIPYPYELDMAISWIATHEDQREKGSNFIFAIRLKESNALAGCINLAIDKRHDHAKIGYWMGYEYWGNGYCTEALKEVIRFGFVEKKLQKIWAEYKSINIASGKVMQKAGMILEGIQRNHYKQADNQYLDMTIKAILRSDYLELNGPSH